ncbi:MULTISPECIES: hypothetical protein [unclassified Caballeronia]|uniref:hypothetical protein n=1 Tax=unclassified Caballeronia TaxID=2646786 RepID=UPI002029B2B4|nr:MULTISPECIES: hypothetical protein [unclassified Caballeronia]
MAYRGEFKDIIYPNGKREARVAQYRLVLIERESEVSVVIHLRREAEGQTYLFERDREFDVVAGRIVDKELRGIRVDRTRLVVESEGAFTEYPLNFNAAEFPSRVSPEEPWKPPVVALESRDIVGGSVALFVDLGAGQSAEPWLTGLLRD